METGVRKPTRRLGPAKCGCESAHETTLPFVGRVVGHVRLYGERGRGGRQRETGTKKTPTREGVDKSRHA